MAQQRRTIRPDGTVEHHDKPLTMARITDEIIKAEFLDTVMLRDRVHVMLVDDNGIDKNLPINMEATKLYWERCGGRNNHHIRGTVVIVPDSDF